MFFVWLGVLLLVAVGVTLVVLQQKGMLVGGGGKQLPSLDRNIFNLQIGDIVQYLTTDWVVEGCLTYDDNGYTWLEYLLQEGDRICWLSVNEDDRVEVAILEPCLQLDVTPTPPKQLSFAGETYRLVESGTASMTSAGKTLNRNAQHCRYFDYEGPGDAVLSVEFWDGDLEVTAGEKINPRTLHLLPGDGKSVYRG